jgi:hypothetical protein
VDVPLRLAEDVRKTYRCSSSDAEPESLVSRTLWRLPPTVTKIVPDTLYSLLWNCPW